MKSSANSPAGLNPRGRKHDKKPESSRFRLPIGSPLGYLLLVFLGFLFFRNAFQDVGTRRVTYSEFKDALRKGQFAKVQISNDWVKGFLKENTADSQEPTFLAPLARAPRPWRRRAGETLGSTARGLRGSS